MRKTAFTQQFPAIKVNYLAPAVLGVLTAIVIAMPEYPYGILIIAGISVCLFCVISAPFGIAILLGLSALFSRAELFSFSLPFFGGGLKPTDFLLASILVGWSVKSLLKHRTPDLPRRLTFIIIAFVSWAILAVLIGIKNGAFYKHSLLELRPLLQFLLILPIASEFTKRDVEKIIIFMLLISVVISAKGIYLYLNGIGETGLFSEGNIRVTNIEFLYLVTSALAALGLLLKRKGPAVLLLAFFCLNCAALAVTYQRAGWLALMISSLILFIAYRDIRRGILISSVVMASGLVVIAYMNISDNQRFIKSLQGRMSSISSYESDVSALHRLEEWKASLKMISHHPVIGNGLGAKVYFYSPMYSITKYRAGYLSDDYYIHNSFIWIAVKTGLIGTALFIILLLSVFRDTLLFLLRSPPGEQRATLSLLASFFAAITISSIFGPMLTSDLVSPLVAFTIGSIYASSKSEERGY